MVADNVPGYQSLERREDVHGIPGTQGFMQPSHSIVILIARFIQSNNDSDSVEAFSISAPGMREMVDIAALNSRVKFDKMDVPFDQRTIFGDATETGLTRFAGRYIQDYDALHKQHPKVFEIPFNSSNKWALVIVRIVCILMGNY